MIRANRFARIARAPKVWSFFGAVFWPLISFCPLLDFTGLVWSKGRGRKRRATKMCCRRVFQPMRRSRHGRLCALRKLRSIPETPFLNLNGGLANGGWPKSAYWGKKGPFGAISALPLWLWGGEELVPIGPEKARMAPDCPLKIWGLSPCL